MCTDVHAHAGCMRIPISSRPLCNCRNLTFADEARNELCDWSAGLFGEKLFEQTGFGTMIVCVHVLEQSKEELWHFSFLASEVRHCTDDQRNQSNLNQFLVPSFVSTIQAQRCSITARRRRSI